MNTASQRQSASRFLFWFAVALACAVIVAPPATSQAGTIRFAFSRVWSQAPLYIGIKLGLFNTANLKTEFIDLRASMKMVEAMFAGSADAGALSLSAALLGRERGLDLKVVAPVASYKDGVGSPNGLYVRKDSGITTLKGLKGKQIGISSYGSSLDMETRSILLANGMDPKKDVQLLEIGVVKGLRAFMAKRLDSYYFPASFVPALKNQQLQLAHMFDIKEYKGQMVLNTPVVMRQKFLNENRETALTWATQYLKALRVITDTPAKANELWTAWSKRRKSVAPYYLPRDGSIELQGVRSTITMMLKHGYLKKPQKASDVIDSELMRQASRRLMKK